LGNNIVSY